MAKCNSCYREFEERNKFDFKCLNCRNKRVIEWISVKDKLPENEEYVLIYTGHPLPAIKFKISFYSTFSKQWMNHDQLKITHWADISQLAPLEE